MKHSWETYKLDIAERAQQGIYGLVGPERGAATIAPFVRPKSVPGLEYDQLIWTPRAKIKEVSVPAYAETAGGGKQGLTANAMETAVVVGMSREEAEASTYWPAAVFWTAEDAKSGEPIWRVGHMATAGVLFESIEGGQTVARPLRTGALAARYSLGIWVPEAGLYRGALTTRLIDDNVPIHELPARYPGLKLS